MGEEAYILLGDEKMNTKPKIITDIELKITMDMNCDEEGIGEEIIKNYNDYIDSTIPYFRLIAKMAEISSKGFVSKNEDIQKEYSIIIEEIAIHEFLKIAIEEFLNFESMPMYGVPQEEYNKMSSHQKMEAIRWCSNRQEEIKTHYQSQGITK